MRNIAVAALVLPVMLAGCVYSHDRDRVATAPAVVQTPPTVIERRVVPETTTTVTQAPVYTAPGTVTTTRRDVVIENHY
jgi:hypothetical protein